MNELRAVPHIKHTQALEDAAIAATRATVDGKAVRICGNPLDPVQVQQAIAETTGRFTDPAFFVNEGTTRLDICDHLILLANLYREHLKAGNVP
jgi:hypothetical protein